MRNLFKILLLTFCGMVAITSCSDDSDGIPGWPWNDNSTEGPENPDVTEIKPRYVWIDAAANFPDYANNKENISTDMVKVKNAGFTDIIVDVRPTTGDVLFNTTAVDQVKRMDVWGSSGYVYYERTGLPAGIYRCSQKSGAESTCVSQYFRRWLLMSL